MQRSNPFFNRNSIAHPRYFYNRTETVRKVLDLLYKGTCIVLTGPRRIGRSSFLRYLSEHAMHAEHGFTSVFFRPFVYVDCTACQDQPQTVFYLIVINRLRSALLRAGLDVSLLSELPPVLDRDTFSYLVNQIADLYGQVTLLLDEFDSVYNNPHMDESFFALLRSLNTQQSVTYCTALLSTRQLAEGVDRYTSTAAFNSIFIRIPLMLFTVDDAHGLVEHELEQAEAQLRFKPELMAVLVEQLAGPHPYLLQIAAYEAFEMAVMHEGSLTVRRLDELQQRFFDQATHYWSAQFNQLSLAEQRALVLLNLGIQPGSDVAASLSYAALIVQTETGWRYISAAFLRFVRTQRIEGLTQLFLQRPTERAAHPHLLLDHMDKAVYLDGNRLNLTSLPLLLLTCLAERPNQIISIQELEMRLWPGDKYYEGSDERIKPHIRLLRDSLGDASHIQNRRGLGYILITA